LTVAVLAAPEAGDGAAGALLDPHKNKLTLDDKTPETVEEWARDESPERVNLARQYLARLQQERRGPERPPELVNGQWWGPHLVRSAVMEHGERLKHRQRMRLVLQGPGGVIAIAAPKYRGSKGYRGKQYRRLQGLLQVPIRPTLFLTFTVDPKRFVNDIEAHAALMAAWPAQREYLRRRHPDMAFAHCTEAQGGGQPHLHVIAYRAPVAKAALGPLGAALARRGVGYVKVEHARRGRRGAVSYLGKYMYADKGRTSAFLPRWKARTFELSGELRELLGPLYPAAGDSGRWRLVAVGDLAHLEEYASDSGVITLDSMAALHLQDADGGTAALFELVEVLGAEPVAELLGRPSLAHELELQYLAAEDERRAAYYGPEAVAARCAAA